MGTVNLKETEGWWTPKTLSLRNRTFRKKKTKGKIGAIGAIRHGFMQEKLYTLSD